MKRRGVLGLLGGAVAAGPAMAKQAIYGLEATTLSGLDIGTSGQITSAVDQFWSVDNPANGTGEYDHGSWLKERMAELIGISPEERQERINGQYVSRLDPDLAVNRSMALWAKINEQKRREYERSVSGEYRHLSKELALWLKRQVLT